MEFNRTMFVETNAELVAVGLHGTGVPATAVNPGLTDVIPACYDLHAPYPNPFNPTTTIRFDLPVAGDVSLIVYDRLGREVATLVDGWFNAGAHDRTFDGNGLASGLYFARFNAGDFQEVQKLLLLK